MKNKIVMMVVGAIVIASMSFYGGMRYGKSSAQPAQGMGRFSDLSVGQQRTGQRGAFAGGGASGEIVSVDNQSITLKLRDARLPASPELLASSPTTSRSGQRGEPNGQGSSKIVFISSSTKIMKSTDGARSDLTSGAQVVVSGTANPDGSITAQSIQLRTELPPQP